MRWCKVWHYSIYQVLTRSKTLHPDVAGLLDADELAYYEASRKGRNLVVIRLRQLIAMAGLDVGRVRARPVPLQACHDQLACSNSM